MNRVICERFINHWEAEFFINDHRKTHKLIAFNTVATTHRVTKGNWCGDEPCTEIYVLMESLTEEEPKEDISKSSEVKPWNNILQ